MKEPKFYDCNNLLELPEVKEIMSQVMDQSVMADKLRMFRRWLSPEHDIWIDACDEIILHAKGSAFDKFLQEVKAQAI